jgi:hypothetical protein
MMTTRKFLGFFKFCRKMFYKRQGGKTQRGILYEIMKGDYNYRIIDLA